MAKAGENMKLIVGLGNPGEKYQNTFHNMGFNAIDDLSVALDIKVKKLECKGLVGVKKDIILAKPQTYMNLSGECVKGLMAKYGVEPCNLMVIYDDLDIDIGKVRLRPGGSAGSHNGMRSIINCIGREDFPRLRVGIGRAPEFMDVADYVLSNIPKQHYAAYEGVFAKVVEAVKSFLCGERFEIIMNNCN